MDKGKALDAALSQIERAFGKGSIMRLGAKQSLQGDIEVISSGSLGLDLALGIGGLPKGRIVEIYGPESSGKTTLALHVIAEAQKRGGTCAFVDAEHALDPGYARKLGVDVDNLLISQPDADLDLVADSAVNAGFGSAGERCMAISVVVAVEPVADSLIAKIKERMLTIKVGDGRRACDMGPLVTKQHRDKVASYIDIAKNDGAVVVVDGRDVNPDGDKNGFWLGPTLIDKVPTSSKVCSAFLRKQNQEWQLLHWERTKGYSFP